MKVKNRLNLPKKVARVEQDRPLAEIKPIANKWSKQEHDRVIKGQEEEEKTIITVSNHLNLGKKQHPNFAVWVGGQVPGDTKNGAIKLDKINTEVSLTLKPELLVDGNLLTWYYCSGWYSNSSIVGPFSTGATFYVPEVSSNVAQKLFSMFHPSLIPGATGRYLTLFQYLSHLERKDYSQFYAQLEAQGISRADFEDACRVLNSLSNERFLKSLFDTTRLNNYKRTGHIVNYYYLYTADKDLVENWVNNNLN